MSGSAIGGGGFGGLLLPEQASRRQSGARLREGSDFADQGELVQIGASERGKPLSPLGVRLATLALLDAEEHEAGWVGPAVRGWQEYPWWRVELRRAAWRQAER
jgi:hypothetical protein